MAGDFGAKVEARLAHDLARSDELAETFLVSEGVARAQRAPAAAGRGRPKEVLRFVRPASPKRIDENG